GFGSSPRLGRFPPEFFNRMIDPRRLLELSQASVNAALAWIQVARTLGRGWLRHYRPEHFERAFDPEVLNRLSPELALASLLLAWETEGTEVIRHFRQILATTLHPRNILRLAERHPETALACLQMATELVSDGLLQPLDPEVLEIFDVRHILDLSERNPE